MYFATVAIRREGNEDGDGDELPHRIVFYGLSCH